jgi:hypothetical protein
MLARHLAVSVVGAENRAATSSMDHTELRAAVQQYFRAQLDVGKERVNAHGPFTPEQRVSFEWSLGMLQEGNREYWKTLGRDFAQSELDSFFQATGLPQEKFKDRIPVVLDEIRKARIGAYKAILAHAEGLVSTTSQSLYAPR